VQLQLRGEGINIFFGKIHNQHRRIKVGEQKEAADLKVGQVAKYVGCHVNTINKYIKEGYVREPMRDRVGHRRFTKSQAERLKAIFNIRVPV